MNDKRMIIRKKGSEIISEILIRD